MTSPHAAPGDIEALIRATFEDVVERPLGELDSETSIAELGIDSVLVAEIVTRLEEALGIEVPVDEWVRVRTLNDVVEAVTRARQQ